VPLMRAARLAPLFVVLALTLGCGTPCQQIRLDRERFLARDRADTRPHVWLDVPFSVVDRLLQQHVDALPRLRFAPPDGGRWGRHLKPLDVVPNKLALRAAPEGRVGLAVALVLYYGGTPTVTLTVELDLRPRVDGTGRLLELAVRADDLRSVKVTRTGDAATRLARHIRGQLPRLVRPLLSDAVVARAADAVLDLVVVKVREAFRGGALAGIGRVARVHIKLPALPISDVSISSRAGSPGGLQLGILTSLPVEIGLARAPASAPADRELVTVHVAGAAVAELANWAMARGDLPARYDGQGRPRPDGRYLAGIAWRSGRRPLEIHVWGMDGAPCQHARLGGQPALRLEGDRIRAEVSDLRLEALDGPALHEIGAFFYALFGPSVDLTAKAASSLRVGVGGREVEARLRAASLHDGDLRLGLTLRARGRPDRRHERRSRGPRM
jgi:hypothetical protein